jgi:hypothetical protein
MVGFDSSDVEISGSDTTGLLVQLAIFHMNTLHVECSGSSSVSRTDSQFLSHRRCVKFSVSVDYNGQDDYEFRVRNHEG